MRGRRGSSTHPFQHIPPTRILAVAPYLGRGSLTGREAGNVGEEPDVGKPLAVPDPGPSQKGKDSLKVHVGVVGNTGTGPGTTDLGLNVNSALTVCLGIFT